MFPSTRKPSYLFLHHFLSHCLLKPFFTHRYPHRTVKTAGRVLAALWEFKSVRSALKNQGWSRYHFATSVPSITSASSQASPLASAPVSPADVDTFQVSALNLRKRSFSQINLTLRAVIIEYGFCEWKQSIATNCSTRLWRTSSFDRRLLHHIPLR